ncbi:MAG TPA: ABC transporter permease [Burkholderiales bacterium]|nr:ABC transporter permease [Burkholderiales bacterium]
MITAVQNIVSHRELIAALAWRNIAVRYKQAYLGIGWAIIKPLTLMLIFSLLRSIIGIETGEVPYAVLTFAALLPWLLFQEAASEGVVSVVGNAHLIKKIYFPREVFPLTAVVTKVLEFAINCAVLLGMMAWYGIFPGAQALWVPLLVLYAVLVALTIAFVGAALNVYYRDVGAALPLALNLMMYASPVIYPLALVQDKLLDHRAAGEWSTALYTLYTANPLAGLIDAFQRVMLKGLPPDFHAMVPGMVVIAIALPFSYLAFKRAESWFADVI